MPTPPAVDPTSPTPVVLVTGVDPEAMASTMLSLAWDTASAVACRHHIDPERGTLTRVVSDVTGLLETEEIDLAHVCVGCAVREEVLPTLERLGRDGRWDTIIAHLPVGAEAEQICAALADSDHAPGGSPVVVSSVIAALDGGGIVDDLLGDDLLAERRLTPEADRRGVGEVLASMVESADVLVTTAQASATGLALVRTLARPDALLVEDPAALAAEEVAGRHAHARTRRWSAAYRSDELAEPASPQVWRVDLRSHLPFDAERLLRDLALLGGGRHRSRGCFWLTSRPGQMQQWAGAGGQLSVGPGPDWGRTTPLTRIVVTGVGVPPAGLREAFEAILLQPGDRVPAYVAEDGLEPWLGPIRSVA